MKSKSAKKRAKAKQNAAKKSGVDEDKEREDKKAKKRDEDEGWETQKYSSGKNSANKRAEKERQKAEEVKIAAAAGDDPLANVTDEVIVPPRMHGRLIGPGGATLTMIRDACKVTIDIPDKKSGRSNIVITGSLLDVRRAKKVIDDLANKGYSSVTHPGQADGHISVPSDFTKVLIGSKGATIKALMTKTDCKINVPEKDGTDTARIEIIGSKDNIKKAKDAIRSLQKYGWSEITHPDEVKEEIEFPFDKLSILIGRAGQTIKSIQGNTKTKIHVPKNSEDPVVIVGKAELIPQAKKEILKLLEEREEPPLEMDPEWSNVDDSLVSWS